MLFLSMAEALSRTSGSSILTFGRASNVVTVPSLEHADSKALIAIAEQVVDSGLFSVFIDRFLTAG